MEHMTKLYAHRPGNGSLKDVRFWANPAAVAELAELKRHYADLLGREVSTSLIMRRAIGHLANHARNTAGNRQDELAALARIIL